MSHCVYGTRRNAYTVALRTPIYSTHTIDCHGITRGLVGKVMVYNATSTIFPVISWRSGLLVEETEENHRPVENH